MYYIEQGGKINGVDGQYTLTFPRAFSNTNYTILKTLNWPDTSIDGMVRWYFGFRSLTLTTATTQTYTSPNGFTEDWIACGY